VRTARRAFDMLCERSLYRYAHGCTLSVARQVLRGYEPPPDGIPSQHVPTRRGAARQQFAGLLETITAND
jgi:hypothetical protein